MKRVFTLLMCTLSLASIPSVNAAAILNPTMTLDAYVSFGEFTSGVDGWTGANTSVPTALSTGAESVLYGVVFDTANGPQLRLQGIQDALILGTGQFDIIEL